MTTSAKAPRPSWATIPENPSIFPLPRAYTENRAMPMPTMLVPQRTRLFSSGITTSRKRTKSAVATTRISGRMLVTLVTSAGISMTIGPIFASIPDVEIAGAQRLARRGAFERRLPLRLDPHHERLHGAVHLPQERLGVDPDPEDEQEDRQHVGHLPRVHVQQMPVLLVRDRPEHHPLEHPEHVDRREDDPARRHHGQPPHRLEGPPQDEELPDEAVQPREPERGEGDDHEDGRVYG